MKEFENYNYLRRHNITMLENLVGFPVYHVYPAQGVVERQIRKIEYTFNKNEWFFVSDCSHRVSELGKTVFLDYEEAHDYHISIMDGYAKSQQERIIKREFERRESELNTLDRLLNKYPTEDSRKRLQRNCNTCKYRDGLTSHTCDMCDGSGEGMYCMWAIDIEKLK